MVKPFTLLTNLCTSYWLYIYFFFLLIYSGSVQKQKSVEEVVIVSDEENKAKDVIETVHIKDASLIDKTEKKQTQPGTAANYISICADETVNEIITLSSSGEEDIVVKPPSKSKRYSKKVNKSETKQNKKLDSKNADLGGKKDELIHPKYKLYEMNKLSPQRKIQKKSPNISTIDLLDDESDKISNCDADCVIQNKKTPAKCVSINKRIDLENCNDIDESVLDFSIENQLSNSTVIKRQTFDIDNKRTSDIKGLVHDMIKFIVLNEGSNTSITWDTFSTDINSLKFVHKIKGKEKNNLQLVESANDTPDVLTSQNFLENKELFDTVVSKNNAFPEEVKSSPAHHKTQGLVDFIRNVKNFEQKNKAFVSDEEKMEEDMSQSQMYASFEEDETITGTHGNCDTDNPQNEYYIKR